MSSDLCTWTMEPTGYWDDEIWRTSCGEVFTLFEDGPVKNNMKFCCHCGKPLVEAPRPEFTVDDD